MATTKYTTSEDIKNIDVIYDKMAEVRDLTAGMGQEIVSYVDTELAAIQAKVDLLDQDGVTASLAKIEAFINAVDANGDNVIDQMASLVQGITDASNAAQTALAKTGVLEAGLQSVINTQNAQQGELAANRGDINSHSTRISDLEAREDNSGLTEAQVRAIAVEQVREGHKTIANAAKEFAEIVLTKSYPITKSDEPQTSDPMPSAGAVESI